MYVKQADWSEVLRQLSADPRVRNMLIGGGLGMAAGGIGSILANDKQVARNAVLASLLGAAGGGLYGQYQLFNNKTPTDTGNTAADNAAATTNDANKTNVVYVSTSPYKGSTYYKRTPLSMAGSLATGAGVGGLTYDKLTRLNKVPPPKPKRKAPPPSMATRAVRAVAAKPIGRAAAAAPLGVATTFATDLASRKLTDLIHPTYANSYLPALSPTDPDYARLNSHLKDWQDRHAAK